VADDDVLGDLEIEEMRRQPAFQQRILDGGEPILVLKLLDREVESSRNYLALRDVARDLWAAYMNIGHWQMVNWYSPDRTDEEITFEERISGFMDEMFTFLQDHGGVPYWLLEHLKREDDRMELGSEHQELFPSDPESLVVTNIEIPTDGSTVSIAVVPRGVSRNNVQVGVVVMVDPSDERYKSLVREVADRAAVLAAYALENTQETSA